MTSLSLSAVRPSVDGLLTVVLLAVEDAVAVHVLGVKDRQAGRQKANLPTNLLANLPVNLPTNLLTNLSAVRLAKQEEGVLDEGEVELVLVVDGQAVEGQAVEGQAVEGQAMEGQEEGLVKAREEMLGSLLVALAVGVAVGVGVAVAVLCKESGMLTGHRKTQEKWAAMCRHLKKFLTSILTR